MQYFATLVLTVATGALDAVNNEVFKWTDHSTSCTASEVRPERSAALSCNSPLTSSPTINRLFLCFTLQGWVVRSPSQRGYTAPTNRLDPAQRSGTHYCNFDGDKQYLPIVNTRVGGNTPNSEKTSGNPRYTMTISVWFRTTWKSGGWTNNWAFLDCDRSEYFNLVVAPDSGKIVFPTSTTQKQFHDTFGNMKDLNDGRWHHVVASWDNGVKKVYVDGGLDVVAQKPMAWHPSVLGTNTGRYCYIGEGSESASFGAFAASSPAG